MKPKGKGERVTVTYVDGTVRKGEIVCESEDDLDVSFDDNPADVATFMCGTRGHWIEAGKAVKKIEIEDRA
jgi:hypothetical protein